MQKHDKLLFLQITGETVGEVRAVSDMHQRKAEMARQADAFIALPGIFMVVKWFRKPLYDYHIALMEKRVYQYMIQYIVCMVC